MEKEIVYLFRQKGTDFVKIGMTKKSDASNRFAAFCTYSPKGAEIVGIILTDNSNVLEKRIHLEYKEKRMSGEFFNLNQEECDCILKKYNNEKTNKLISVFFELLSQEENDMDLFLKEMKSKIIKSKSITNDTYAWYINDFLNKIDTDLFLTNNEIKIELEKNYNITILNQKVLGSNLRNLIGIPFNKKIKGITKSVYHLKK
jgi:hypothetical protein